MRLSDEYIKPKCPVLTPVERQPPVGDESLSGTPGRSPAVPRGEKSALVTLVLVGAVPARVKTHRVGDDLEEREGVDRLCSPDFTCADFYISESCQSSLSKGELTEYLSRSPAFIRMSPVYDGEYYHPPLTSSRRC